MKTTSEDIAKVIREARIEDSLKKKLIVRIAKAKLSLTDYEFGKYFEKIKEKLEEQERMLN